jgi:hypothetical protein
MSNNNTTECLNGELCKGDVVLSDGSTNYPYLVGVVTEITKTDSPDHDTGNDGDDVLVDFSQANYSRFRVKEIEFHFSELCKEEKTFAELPLDYVVMPPESLIRITGLEIEKMNKLVEDMYHPMIFVSTPELWPMERIMPNVSNDTYIDTQENRDSLEEHRLSLPAEDNLRNQITARLDANIAFYKEEQLRELSKEGLFEAAAEIAAVCQAHEYFTLEHAFTTGQAEFLLKFQNPLELLSDRWSDGQGIGNTISAIFSEQERMLKNGGYELAADAPDAATEHKTLEKNEPTSGYTSVRDIISSAKRDNPQPFHNKTGHLNKGEEIYKEVTLISDFGDKIQALVDEFYSEWQQGKNQSKGKWEILDGFSEAHKVAVIFGNFNNQVENGGINQWIYNGYFHEDAERLIEHLEVGAAFDERFQTILDSIYKLDQYARDTDCDRYGNLCDPDDEDGDISFLGDMINSDAFDTWYYKYCGENDWWESVCGIIDELEGRESVAADREQPATGQEKQSVLKQIREAKAAPQEHSPKKPHKSEPER